jgi:hypothetical protein
VRDKVTLSLAGNLDSFFAPATSSSPHMRPQSLPLSSHFGRAQQVAREKEGQDWKPDMEEMEEELATAPSKDSDRSPV